MARIGDELPDLVLAFLTGSEGGCDVSEHTVDRGADLTDVGVRIGIRGGHTHRQRHLATVERKFGDTRRGCHHALKRTQRQAHDGCASQSGERKPGETDGSNDGNELQEHCLHIAHRQAGDQEDVGAHPARRNPIVAKTATEADRHGLAVRRHVQQP